MAGSWKFLQRFPTPEALAKAGRRKWENFLHCHKLYRPQTHDHRLACFEQATQFCGSPGVTRAKSLLALSLVEVLIVLEKQLQEYRTQIEKLFAKHPDHDLFGSLPGAGPKLAPRLLSEIGEDRQLFPDAQSLQCYAGTAPVSYQSGQVHKVYLRRQCNKHLRCAIHLWSDLSRRWCPWAQVYYQQLRQRGKSHAAALHRLACRMRHRTGWPATAPRRQSMSVLRRLAPAVDARRRRRLRRWRPAAPVCHMSDGVAVSSRRLRVLRRRRRTEDWLFSHAGVRSPANRRL